MRLRLDIRTWLIGISAEGAYEGRIQIQVYGREVVRGVIRLCARRQQGRGYVDILALRSWGWLCGRTEH